MSAFCFLLYNRCMEKLTKIIVGLIILVAAVVVYVVFFEKAQAPQVVLPVGLSQQVG